MQAEIDADGWSMQPQILGVNQTGHDSENAAMCDGRSLPWLQEIPEQAVWQDWDVTYRDVIILDGENRPVAVFNLTEHDLADPAEYEALKTLLRQCGQ